MKFLILGVALAFVAILSAVRREQSRKKLAMLEDGKLCVHCGSSKVTSGKAGVVCGACGMTTSWTLIRQPALTNQELDEISKRDSRNPLH
jgi:transcription elongation factor Elf1